MKVRNFMRLSGVIAALLVAAPLGLGVPAAAQPFVPFEGQTWWGGRPNTPPAGWCLNLNSGAGRVEEDCSFTSYRACRFALGNPSNGFCTQSWHLCWSAAPTAAAQEQEEAPRSVLSPLLAAVRPSVA